MTDSFKALKISDHVYWVGAVDWHLRDFHGYATHQGTSYNAFLITGEYNVLVDTVKSSFKQEMFSRISSVINPEKIDYVISNHAEMDHSACIPDILNVATTAKVFTSGKGVQALTDHFHGLERVVAIQDGENMKLGNMGFRFFNAPMLHWPESMLTFYEEDRILFSQDIFGMHVASSERFDDEVSPELLDRESARYFANIVLPYSQMVTKILDKIKSADLPITLVAPDHGPIWRKNIAGIQQQYGMWALQKPTRKAVVIYDTMWQSTGLMAKAIVEGLTSNGSPVKLMKLGISHRSDIAVELLDAGALIAGSPTLNNNMFPTVADVMTYLKGLKPRNLIGAVFGSYGWGGEAVKQLRGMFEEMKIELVGDSIKCKYVPGKDDLQLCHDLGYQIASKLTSISETA